jgi:hypothetical protein
VDALVSLVDPIMTPPLIETRERNIHADGHLNDEKWHVAARLLKLFPSLPPRVRRVKDGNSPFAMEGHGFLMHRVQSDRSIMDVPIGAGQQLSQDPINAQVCGGLADTFELGGNELSESGFARTRRPTNHDYWGHKLKLQNAQGGQALAKVRPGGAGAAAGS